MIGQKDDLALMDYVLPGHPAGESLVVLGGLRGEHDDLVGTNVRVRRRRIPLADRWANQSKSQQPRSKTGLSLAGNCSL